MTKRAAASLVAALLALVLLAGCGGSSYSSNATSGSSNAQPSTSPATVGTSVTSLGTILVDSQGKTLYLFQRDSGPTSTCDGACVQQWPAVTTHGQPQAGSGATASQLGTTKRSDGTTQITYAGHPLYYYAGDSAKGDTNGQGIDAFGAKWYVVAPSGTAITGQASGSTSGSNSRYGY